MSGANFERPAPAQQPPPLQSAKLHLNSLTGLPRAQLGGLLCTQAEDMAQGVPRATRAVHRTAFAWASSMLKARPGKPLSPSGKPLSHYERLATLKAPVNEVFAERDNMQQFLEEQELWLAEDHIAFDAASRIQADKNEARELEAQEQLRAQDKENAQYLEQENERLRIQARIDPDYTVAARQGAFQELGQPTTVAVAAAEPKTGVREMETSPPPRRSSPWRTRTTTSRSRPRPARRRAARSTSRSRARSQPTRARTPSAPRTSTSPSTPAPRSRLAPSHASGLTTTSTLRIRILLSAAFGPFFIRRAD